MRIVLSLLFAISISHAGFAQSYTLTVEITDMKVIEESMARIAVYNSEETYFNSDQIFRSGAFEVKETVGSFTFEDMPEGTYAITIYHDEDNDGEMDRRWYGPPKEGYAFSNNYHSAFKPASFEDAAFEVKEDTRISVKMRY
jgi:uncharacterized protein (DUF2141 family)